MYADRMAKVNHGLQLSVDNTQLFASSREGVYSWPYDPKEPKVTGDYSTWITGMNQTGHSTRTLLISQKVPGLLLVSRGSGPNIDPLARDITTGVSQIRVFNITGTPTEYKYTDGKVIGWGLRNSVGMGENPADGGIWSNENASDNMFREEKDIHETSPGEEVNYHGTLAASSELHGKNYGYPDCAAAWDIPNLPRNTQLKVGSQFTHNDTVQGIDDQKCNKDYIHPRLTLPSHWAPIDIAFNSKGTVAYMTSHGSWLVFILAVNRLKYTQLTCL
jgi:glucose/arabinose dehydrogenase